MSPGVSETGSFDQGVSRFSRLLSAQVVPRLLSVTRQPNSGFASTLLQGAGVCSPASRRITYSRPSSLNPPRPLSNFGFWILDFGASMAGLAGACSPVLGPWDLAP